MTSTAKLAQGTILSIAGTPGSALTLTDVTRAVGAVCSCTTPPAIGTAVLFGAIAGMPEIAGRVGIVTAVAAGASFTVNIDSSGFSGEGTGGTATPQTWTVINNLKDWNGFEGTVGEVDISNTLSQAKEFAPGLEDFGSVTGTVDLDWADPGQILAMKAKGTQLTTLFRLGYPHAAAQRVFNGFVKKFGEQGQVDGVIKSAFEVRCTGRVVRSEVVI